jgi:FkbH-like protein
MELAGFQLVENFAKAADSDDMLAIVDSFVCSARSDIPVPFLRRLARILIARKVFPDSAAIKKWSAHPPATYLAGLFLLGDLQEQNALETFQLIASIESSIGRAASVECAKIYLKSKEYGRFTASLQRTLDNPADVDYWGDACKLLTRLRKERSLSADRTARIAILSSSTTNFLVSALKVALFREKIRAEFYECPYGNYRQDALDPNSGLYLFKPDFIFIVLNHRDANLQYYSDEAERTVSDVIQNHKDLWKTISQKSNAHMIQTNFDIPHYDSLGNLGTQIEGARSQVVNQINEALRRECPKYVTILDQVSLQVISGSDWIDESMWYLAQQYPSTLRLPTLCQSFAAVVRARMGLSKKALVLDLDNTLWGGVIGEDGLDGIKLGPPSQVGEAFVDFHKYILELKSRGIILAVCSKNNLADAQSPFETHENSLLKLSDFAVFVANWDDKATNIKNIASTLNIGTDSLVFIDDNPLERKLVRDLLPEVAVPELPVDPAHFVRSLSAYRYFETSALSKEDFERNASYHQNAQREILKSKSGSIDEFLKSLRMSSEHSPIDERNIIRVTQLIGKTNQFNVTTRRHSEDQVRAISKSAKHWSRAFRLSDCFGDHGLIGVIVAEINSASVWSIDTWLMSCRVIGRTMERFMLDTMIEAAAKSGAQKLRGTFIPTSKNQLVADLFERMGFTIISDSPDGVKVFELDVMGGDKKQGIFIMSKHSANPTATCP